MTTLTEWSALRFMLRVDGEPYRQVNFLGAAAVLKVENSSHTVTPLGDGLVQHTFSVFSANGASNIIAIVRSLEYIFSLAHELHQTKNPHKRVMLYERHKDEIGARQSNVIGGTISSLVGGVLTKDLKRDAARFIITIDRLEMWEYGTPQQHRELGISLHGGMLTLPKLMAQGQQSGRIKTLVVEGQDTTKIKRFWMGIKAAHTDLSVFSSEISLINNGGADLEDIAQWDDDTNAATGYHDGDGIMAHWAVDTVANDGTAWAKIFRIFLTQFNSFTGTRVNRPAYHGKYHLLLRYRTDPDLGQTYGLQAAHGWDKSDSITKLEPVYVTPTNEQFHYVDLGIINIGGEAFSYEMLQRGQIRNFSLSIHGTVIDPVTDIDGTNTTWLYIDNMRLVPAEHFIHAELKMELGGANATKRAEFYTQENGSVSGMVVFRNDTDWLGQEHPNIRQIYEVVEEIDTSDWSIPTTENSVLVFVGDSETSTLSLTAKGNTELSVMTRTANI